MPINKIGQPIPIETRLHPNNFRGSAQADPKFPQTPEANFGWAPPARCKEDAKTTGERCKGKVTYKGRCFVHAPSKD